MKTVKIGNMEFTPLKNLDESPDPLEPKGFMCQGVDCKESERWHPLSKLYCEEKMVCKSGFFGDADPNEDLKYEVQRDLQA